MKHNFYPFRASKDFLRFTFESESAHKRINKVVEFVLIEDELYNLAFGDLGDNGMYDDLSVSNNSDMNLVLATVIQTIFNFFEIYPDKKLFFQGSTPARSRLYQIIIAREREQWQEDYVIEGVFGEEREVFQLTRNYNAFILSLKSCK